MEFAQSELWEGRHVCVVCARKLKKRNAQPGTWYVLYWSYARNVAVNFRRETVFMCVYMEACARMRSPSGVSKFKLVYMYIYIMDKNDSSYPRDNFDTQKWPR